MAKEDPRPLTSMEILRKGVKLLWSSCKSAVLIIFLAILLLGCLGHVVTSSALSSSAARFIKKEDAISGKQIASEALIEVINGFLEDLREMGRALIVGSLIYYLLYSFTAMAIIPATSIISRRRVVGLRDLFLKIRNSWIGVMGTTLILLFLLVGYLGFCGYLLSGVVFFAGLSESGLAMAAATVAVELLLFLNLGTVWSQGVVVSAMEEGISGLEALGRAESRIRGKKGVGFRVNGLLFLAVVFVQILISAAAAVFPLSDLMLWVVYSLANQLLVMVALAVSAVFYYECHETQEEGIPIKENFAYNRAPQEE